MKKFFSILLGIFTLLAFKTNAQIPDAAQQVDNSNQRRQRAEAAEAFGTEAAEALRILYGGSVKPENAKALMTEQEIDGALVGGASLSAESFAAIVKY